MLDQFAVEINSKLDLFLDGPSSERDDHCAFVVQYGTRELLQCFRPLFAEKKLSQIPYLLALFDQSVAKSVLNECNALCGRDLKIFKKKLTTALSRQGEGRNLNLDEASIVRFSAVFFSKIDDAFVRDNDFSSLHLISAACLRFGQFTRVRKIYESKLNEDDLRRRRLASTVNYATALIADGLVTNAHTALLSEVRDDEESIAELGYTIALNSMRLGDRALALKHTRDRLRMPNSKVKHLDLSPFIDWVKSCEKGCNVLLVAEQGVADVFLFASFLPQFKEQYDIGELGLLCGRKSARLLDAIFPWLRVFPADPSSPPRIPKSFRHFGYLSEVPLVTDHRRTFRLKVGDQPLNHTSKKYIGISWRSHIPAITRGPVATNGLFPSFYDVKSVISRHKQELFLVLQPHLTESETNDLKKLPNVRFVQHPEKIFDDLLYCLAVVNTCHSVIGYSIVCYLAASLGKPSFTWNTKTIWLAYGRGSLGAFELIPRISTVSSYGTIPREDFVNQATQFILEGKVEN